MGMHQSFCDAFFDSNAWQFVWKTLISFPLRVAVERQIPVELVMLFNSRTSLTKNTAFWTSCAVDDQEQQLLVIFVTLNCQFSQTFFRKPTNKVLKQKTNV